MIIILFNYLAETFPLNVYTNKQNSKCDLTVLCYNVKSSTPSYKFLQVLIARVILKESPDVAYLCEFNLSQSKILDSIMIKEGGYRRFYKSGTNCVFYSKFEIDSIHGIDTGTYRKGHHLNNMIHLFLANDTVAVFGCHLSSSRKGIVNAYHQRAKEADSLFYIIKAEPFPVIVMGDLNDFSGSYVIKRLKEAGLKDAWWEGGCGYGATFHDKWLKLRLDHILYNKDKLNLQYVKVIDSDLSDHNAMVAGFIFNK